MLAWVWLAGGAALAGYILIRAFGLWRAVASERPVTEQPVLELLEDCKMQMRVRTLVGVVVTDKVRTPALFGVIRPRILLPQGLIETIGLDELHYVFLHELAHLRRRDIYLAWLVCLLQVLHWFNPLIWFAFRRMRADQKMAADALALAAAGTEESRRYGQTILSLLERFSQPQYLPSLAGILENPSHIERRMIMIARFKNNSYRSSPLAATLIVVLACVTLPDGKRTQAVAVSPAGPEAITATLALGQAAIPGDHAQEKGLAVRELRIDWNAHPQDFSLSRDGNKLTYRKMKDDKYNLVVRNLVSGVEAVITNYTTGHAASPVFSPDGQEIVYTYWSDDGTGGLHVVSLPSVSEWVRQFLADN